MVQVSIEYDKEQYAPGDTVSAKIIVDVRNSPKKICSIKISVIGCAIVKWEETQSNGKTNTTKRYSSTHFYLSRSDFLLKPLIAGKKLMISVGRHIYRYKFTLPLSCDSSYSKGYGRIKYECSVEVARSFLRCNIKEKKIFIVRRPVDLRGYRFISPPVSQTLETRFFPFQKGSITLKGNIHHACYLPEQIIFLEVSICNRAPRVIRKIEIRLVEATTYIAYYGSRAYHRVHKQRLVNVSQNLQIATGSDYFYSREITIPHFTPLRNTCPYIKVIYYLKVRICTSSVLGTSLSLKIPVVIGTIPITHSNPHRLPTIYHLPSEVEVSSVQTPDDEISIRGMRIEDSFDDLCSDDSIDAADFSKYNDRSPLLR